MFVPAGCVLKSEAEGNELTLCSDSDISMGQSSSIMMRWLRRPVNCFELAGCLLCCSQSSVPGDPRTCSIPGNPRTCSIPGGVVCGAVLGRAQTPTQGMVGRTGDPHYNSAFGEHSIHLKRQCSCFNPRGQHWGEVFPLCTCYFLHRRQADSPRPVP